MIHLTCGHTVEDLDDSYPIAIKAWDITEEGWVKCIHYMSVCKECLEEYKAEDAILHNEYEESLWINHRVEDRLCTHEEQQEWAKKHRNDPWEFDSNEIDIEHSFNK